MSKSEQFEQLVAWQKARTLTKRIYEVTQEGAFARDFGLRDQIRRASVSVMSNIAEGYDRNSPAEFARFLAIAKGSCAEVRSQLYAALDVEYLTPEYFGELMSAATEVSRIISGLRSSVVRRHG